jgi:MFS family permease
LVLNFLITGSFGAGLGYNTELFPTQIRGTAVGVAFTLGSAAAASSPAIVAWIATSHSIAAALPLLALSFFLLVPMFLFVARETDAQGARRFRRPKDLIASPSPR